MDEKTLRLIRWAEGKPQPPSTIELITTDRCNFNCASCWRQGVSKEELEKKYENEMSDERLLRLIDEAAEMGVIEFALVGGGEPLSRPITFDVMRRIRKHGMLGDLVTNGSYFTDKFVEELIDMEWTRIKVSVDGSSAEIQNELRGVDCYDSIFRSLKHIRRLKDKYGKDKPRIGFNTVVSNKNYRDIPNIIKLAHDLGVEEILILPITVFSDEGKKLKLNSEQMKEFQEVISESLPLLKKYGVHSNLESFRDERFVEKTNSMHEVLMDEADKEDSQSKKTLFFKKDIKKNPIENFLSMPCFEPWKHITIISNGNIASCFNDYVWNTKISIKNHTLKELWYGPYFDKYRKQIMTRKLPDACATCCVWRVFEVQEIRDKIKNHLRRKKIPFL